jgi:hypothetical protein
MFNKVSIAAVALIGLVSASPVLASGKNQEANVAPKEQPDVKAKARYCVNSEALTGSIQRGRVCKTAEQWRAEGVDIGNLQSRN